MAMVLRHNRPTAPVVTPPTFVWPNASNTGVPAGQTLTPYTGPWVITTSNTTITNKSFANMISCANCNNITFINCRFSAPEQWVLECDTATNITCTDCTVDNGVKGILAQGTFTRLNISNCIIGITLKDGVSTIRNCYIHDLDAHLQPADPHFDGLFISGGQNNCLIEDNLFNIPGSGGTSSIFIATRWQNSHIVNTTVNHNRMLGTPSFAMYNEQTSVATITGTRWTNNEVQRGFYGYFLIQNSTVFKSGNVDAFTGANIDAEG